MALNILRNVSLPLEAAQPLPRTPPRVRGLARLLRVQGVHGPLSPALWRAPDFRMTYPKELRLCLGAREVVGWEGQTGFSCVRVVGEEAAS